VGEKFRFRSDYGPSARMLIQALAQELCILDSRGIHPIPEWLRWAFDGAARGDPQSIDHLIDSMNPGGPGEYTGSYVRWI
jgi:hypothetical protein